MFGRMTVEPVVQVNPTPDLESAVAALLGLAETSEVVRWIEFPASVLLFLLVPGDPESGALYVLDRKKGTWYAIDFEDERFGGYSISDLGSAVVGAARKTTRGACLTEKIFQVIYQHPDWIGQAGTLNSRRIQEEMAPWHMC
jgi:hypothetical protein